MHLFTMAAVRSSLTLTQSDDVEVMSAKSYSVLDTEPPDYVEKISRFLESSVARGEQVSNELAEAESDSGDSLFLTQKPAPEPVRPQRRQRSLLSVRSQPVTPRSLEESGSDSDSDCSSSALHGQSKTDKGNKRKKYCLPKYSFPFLSERKWKPEGSLLNRKQNINLHYATIGGFFGCVREQWKGFQGGDDVASTLPTVNMEGDYVSPLTESEDERSGDEDLKIVEKKDFAFPSKANRRQTWCSRSTQRRGKANKTPPETPRTRQQNSQTENPKTKNQSKTRRSIFKEETKEQELFDDSDITDCEPPTLQWDPRQSTNTPEPQTDAVPVDGLSQTWQEQPEAQNVLHCDNDDDKEYSQTRLKSRENKEAEGDHESAEEESSQGQDEPEGLYVAPSVSVDVEETDRQSEQSIAEPPASHTSEVLEFNEINCMENAPRDDPIVREEERETPDLKQKKKKRKKSLAGDVRQEVDGNLISGMKLAESMLSVSSGVESDSKEKRKKRRKKGGEDDEGGEHLQPDVVTEPLNDHAETQRKKKKKRKEKTVLTDEHEDKREEEPSNRALNLPPVSVVQLEESAHFVENTAASQDTPLNDHAEIQRNKKKKRKEKTVITDGHEEEEPSSRTLNLLPLSAGQSDESAHFVENTQDTLEPSFVKRKKHKKKHRSSSNDAAKDGAAGEDDDDAGAFQEGTVSPKKKKKKKKEISDEIDTSYSPDNNERVKNVDNMENTPEGLEYQSAEIVTKKKKKKKKKEIPEGVDTSYTLGGSEMVEVIGDTEKTHSGLDDQTAELVIKKKKKKKTKLSSSNLSEDSLAKSNDSVSVQEKEKMRTASFLTADAEENDAQTHQEQNRVKKKNRKRKMSAQQDSVERDHGQDFEEPKRTCLSTMPETAARGVKRKQEHEEYKGESETPVEQFDSRADGGSPLTDEALMMKKKKKKKKKKSQRTRHQLTE